MCEAIHPAFEALRDKQAGRLQFQALGAFLRAGGELSEFEQAWPELRRRLIFELTVRETLRVLAMAAEVRR